MPRIHANGIEIYYEISGDGPPLLLIAGFASDSASFGPIRDRLAKEYRVIVFDNRGSGRTKYHGQPINLSVMSADCITILDKLKIERAYILGHSMGGVIAMNIASQYPNRVERLVIAATTPDDSPFQIHVLQTIYDIRAMSDDPKLWLKAFFPWLFHPRFFDNSENLETSIQNALAYPYAQDLQAMKMQLVALAHMRQNLQINKILTPTLCILAENDLFYPIETAKRALAKLPNAQIHIIPNAGHSVHWDQPEEFCELVLEYLR